MLFDGPRKCCYVSQQKHDIVYIQTPELIAILSLLIEHENNDKTYVSTDQV